MTPMWWRCVVLSLGHNSSTHCKCRISYTIVLLCTEHETGDSRHSTKTRNKSVNTKQGNDYYQCFCHKTSKLSIPSSWNKRGLPQLNKGWRVLAANREKEQKASGKNLEFMSIKADFSWTWTELQMETMLHMVKSQHSGSSDSSTNSEFLSHVGTKL